MNKKSLLLNILIAMTVIGMLLLSIPFILNFSMNDKQEYEAWGACDVSDLLPGAIKKCGWAMVYHRTSIDKSSISKFEHLLADPKSINSEQPEHAQNQWRSENPDFFVFKPWAPVRSCGVKLRSPNESLGLGSTRKRSYYDLTILF